MHSDVSLARKSATNYLCVYTRLFFCWFSQCIAVTVWILLRCQLYRWIQMQFLRTSVLMVKCESKSGKNGQNQWRNRSWKAWGSIFSPLWMPCNQMHWLRSENKAYRSDIKIRMKASRVDPEAINLSFVKQGIWKHNTRLNSKKTMFVWLYMYNKVLLLYIIDHMGDYFEILILEIQWK